MMVRCQSLSRLGLTVSCEEVIVPGPNVNPGGSESAMDPTPIIEVTGERNGTRDSVTSIGVTGERDGVRDRDRDPGIALAVS